MQYNNDLMLAIPKYVDFTIFEKLTDDDLVNTASTCKALFLRVGEFFLWRLQKNNEKYKDYKISHEISEKTKDAEETKGCKEIISFTGTTITLICKLILFHTIDYRINHMNTEIQSKQFTNNMLDCFNMTLDNKEIYANFDQENGKQYLLQKINDPTSNHKNEQRLVSRNLNVSFLTDTKSPEITTVTISRIANNYELVKFKGKTSWRSEPLQIFDATNKCFFYIKPKKTMVIFDIEKVKTNSTKLHNLSDLQESENDSFHVLRGVENPSYACGMLCEILIDQDMQKIRITNINNLKEQSSFNIDKSFRDTILRGSLMYNGRMISKNIFLGITFANARLFAYNIENREGKLLEEERDSRDRILVLSGITVFNNYLYILYETQITNVLHTMYFKCFKITELFNKAYKANKSICYFNNPKRLDTFYEDMLNKLQVSHNKIVFRSDDRIFIFSAPDLLANKTKTIQKVDSKIPPTLTKDKDKIQNDGEENSTESDTIEDEIQDNRSVGLPPPPPSEPLINNTRPLELASALLTEEQRNSNDITPHTPLEIQTALIPEIELKTKINKKTSIKKCNLIKGVVLITEVAAFCFGVVALFASLGHPMTHTLLTGLSKVGIIGSSGWIAFALVTIGITGGIIYRYRQKQLV